MNGAGGWPLPTGLAPLRSIILWTGGPAGAERSGSGRRETD